MKKFVSVAALRAPLLMLLCVCTNVPVTSAQSIQAGQANTDIGQPAISGHTNYAAGLYTIRAAGTDIWDVADQFHFVHQPVSGDVTVVARVHSLITTHPWAKAGVMLRESLTAASRHAATFVSAGSGYAFQRRADPGVYSTSSSGGSGRPPGWVKLVRSGDTFSAYRSVDGTTWTKIGSDTIAMNETVYVGLAVTSHNAATPTTAIVDNLKIVTATGAATANRAPAVSLTAPVNGTQVIAPSTVTVTAVASDPENRMASVDFYAGSTLIRRDTTAPYSASWSATTAGTVALSAVAHDADGGSTRSSTVNVIVATATNKAPTVSLAAGGTSFRAPATITLTAMASDPEGQLARVEFFNRTTRLASDTTAPYTFSWSNVAAGTYAVTAVAYDAAGASATTAVVNITVGAAASAAPTSVVFAASADHATNVTSYMLKVFAAGANTATATPLATSDLGKPAPASTGDITVDRSAFFTALAAGKYLAAVTAIGPGGHATSTSVTFTR